MFIVHWIVDNGVLLAGLFALLTLAAVVIWKRFQKRAPLWGALVCACMVLLILTLRSTLQTDRMRISSSLQQMVGAVKTRQYDKLFAHFSERFTFQNLDKAEFRKRAIATMDRREVEEMTAWDEEFENLDRNAGTVTVVFKAKPRGAWGDRPYFLVRSQWVRDADGRWRLRTFDVFEPFVNTNVPIRIPGF